MKNKDYNTARNFQIILDIQNILFLLHPESEFGIEHEDYLALRKAINKVADHLWESIYIENE
jgi:hypothetical protein